MNRPLCLHPLALTQWERILLHGGGDLGFRPAPRPEPVVQPTKRPVDYGKTWAVALRVARGEFAGMSFPEIAEETEVNSESLRAATWRARQGIKPGKPRRAVA